MTGDWLHSGNLPRLAVLLVFCGAAFSLQACVSSPTDALTLSNPLLPPKNSLPADQPGVRKGGAFPVIGETPEAATKQLTSAEKDKIKADLKPAISGNGAQAAKTSQTEYDRDVAEMRRLLQKQERKRRSQNF